jgi:hypothetical protein
MTEPTPHEDQERASNAVAGIMAAVARLVQAPYLSRYASELEVIAAELSAMTGEPKAQA